MRTVLVQEPSFRYMLLLAAITIGAMFYFPTSRTEKAVLLAMIFFGACFGAHQFSDGAFSGFSSAG